MLLGELLQILRNVKPNIQEDHFVWWRHNHGFLVKNCYKRILEFSNLGNLLDPLKTNAFECLWKSEVSSKILIFGWSLILNKLSTRKELTKRGIMNGVHNVVCPFYFMEEENV